MPNLDFKFLEENSYLIEKDFNSLSRRFADAINPVATTSIRKQMVFSPIDYPIYCKDYILNQPIPEGMDDLVADITVVPLFFHTAFGVRFFPRFEDEYWSPLELGGHHLDTPLGKPGCSQAVQSEWETLNGLKPLENCNYHALTYAAYEIETKCKESFMASRLRQLTHELEIISQFFVPFDMDSEFKVALALHVNLIM